MIKQPEPMMKKDDDVFQIPVSSMTKKEQRNEMRRMVKDHGDTDPLKLEERRIVVSERMYVVQKQIETLQLSKKAMIAEHDKRLKELRMSCEKNENQEILQEISAVEASKAANTMQYDTLIGQQISNQNIAELLCLVVDGVTVREEVESTSGKKGMMRFSSAFLTSEVDFECSRTYKRMRKLYELQRVMALAQIPRLIEDLKKQRESTRELSMERLNIDNRILELNKVSGQIVANTDEDFESDEECKYKDEDVLGVEEREAIKKNVRDGGN